MSTLKKNENILFFPPTQPPKNEKKLWHLNVDFLKFKTCNLDLAVKGLIFQEKGWGKLLRVTN